MAQTIREVLGLQIRQNLGVHRTYRIWKAMKGRCKVHHVASGRYAKRGIYVCERWNNFLNFLSDMGHPPSNTHSIDRRNNNGIYEMNNCRWATKQEQSDNKCNVSLYVVDSEKLTLKGIADKFKINYHTLRWRLNKGMSLIEATSYKLHTRRML